MQGSGHAIFNAFGITIAQVALGCGSAQAIKVNAAKRAGVDAHFAAHAIRFSDNDRACTWITVNGGGGANFQTGSRLALGAGKGENGSSLQVIMNPDVAIFPLESARFLKRTDPFTIPAGQTPVLFD